MSDQTVKRLAGYATSLGYDDLSPEVVHQAKRLIVDSMGCAIGAFHSAPARAVRELASSYTSSKSATLLGTSIRTTPDLAAFVNGIMVRYLDFNDNYAGKSNSHPSDNIPVVMAAAEAYGASGKALITGIVLAYEVQSAWADTFRLRDGGPWDQAVYAAISTPLGTGKVMGLTEEQLAEALHISVVQGLSLGEARRGTLSNWKACAVPNAGRNGILSAMLAKQGLTGPPDIFEGTAGFFAGVTRGPVNLEALARERGNDRSFRMMKSNIKRFPTGYPSQTAIEGALEAREALGISDGRNIRRILIKTCAQGFKAMAESRTRWRPSTRETADHSIPYVVACSLHFGFVETAHFEETMLRNPELEELMDKTEVQLDSECEAEWPDAILNKVTVETSDGRIHLAENRYHLGHFKRPLSDGGIEEKFCRLTQGLLKPVQRNIALKTLWRLEEMDDIAEIFRNMVIRSHF